MPVNTEVSIDDAGKIHLTGAKARMCRDLKIRPYIAIGTYSFVLPDLAPGAIRELRAPDAGDDDDE
jgi:hypothetical protein